MIMSKAAAKAIGRLFDAFPQSSGDPDLTLDTFDRILEGVPDEIIIDTVKRFLAGDVADQSLRFAPSIAEFNREARRIAECREYLDRPRISGPSTSSGPHKFDDRKTRIRMGFKMALLSTAISIGKVDDVDKANRRGLDDLIALAQQWGVPVPDELWQKEKAA